MRAHEDLTDFVHRPGLFLRRSDEAEWLDQGRGTRADAAENLAEMWRINRQLGGLSAITRHLYPRLSAAYGKVTLLDLGTGAADIPVAIGQWARQRGVPVKILAVDRALGHLGYARARLGMLEAEVVWLVCAEAEQLPLAKGGMDYVISSLFLHHLTPQGVVDVLRAAFGAARRGIVMSDLVRGRMPLAAFKLMQPFFARNFLTRHDGLASIRRAYSPGELRALAQQAGLTNAQVHWHWPWRMTLVADRA